VFTGHFFKFPPPSFNLPRVAFTGNLASDGPILNLSDAQFKVNLQKMDVFCGYTMSVPLSLGTGARTSCHAVDLRRRVQSVIQRVEKPVLLCWGLEGRGTRWGRIDASLPWQARALPNTAVLVCLQNADRNVCDTLEGIPCLSLSHR